MAKWASDKQESHHIDSVVRILPAVYYISVFMKNECDNIYSYRLYETTLKREEAEILHTMMKLMHEGGKTSDQYNLWSDPAWMVYEYAIELDGVEYILRISPYQYNRQATNHGTLHSFPFEQHIVDRITGYIFQWKD